jgi:uncharacterized metal-binding protein YceD (DUF177 family)
VKSPVSFLAHVTRLPRGGLPVAIEADAEEREALAREHSLVSVESYRADLLVTAWKRHGVSVKGKVEADITQNCVVTLEPVGQHISEDVSGLYFPEDSRIGREGFETGGEIILDPEGPDAPETFTGDTIDVGALAEEFFALAIDPYPRKPGVTLERAQEEEAKESPFAKLARLQRKS